MIIIIIQNINEDLCLYLCRWSRAKPGL